MDYPTPENSHNGSSMSSIPSLSWQNDDTNQPSNETSHDGQPNELPEEVLQAEREAMENMDQAMADLREDPPAVEAVLAGDENSGEASYTSPTRIHHVTAEMHEANAEHGGTPDGGTPLWDPQTPSNHGQNLNLATRGRFAWAAMALPEELEKFLTEHMECTETMLDFFRDQGWATIQDFGAQWSKDRQEIVDKLTLVDLFTTDVAPALGVGLSLGRYAISDLSGTTPETTLTKV